MEALQARQQRMTRWTEERPSKGQTKTRQPHDPGLYDVLLRSCRSPAAASTCAAAYYRNARRDSLKGVAGGCKGSCRRRDRAGDGYQDGPGSGKGMPAARVPGGCAARMTRQGMGVREEEYAHSFVLIETFKAARRRGV